MMVMYETEEQQVEALKKWWKENAKMIIAGVLIAAVVGFGWRFWQRRELKIADQASVLYEQMLIATRDHQAPIKPYATRLVSDYSGTAYASLAQLFVAKRAVEDNKFEDAEKALRWVVKSADVAALKQIARLRLARILIQQQQPQQALTLLKKVDDKSYLPAIDVLRGDIYMRLENKTAAKQAYQQALHGLVKNAMIRPWVVMKLDQV